VEVYISFKENGKNKMVNIKNKKLTNVIYL